MERTPEGNGAASRCLGPNWAGGGIIRIVTTSVTDSVPMTVVTPHLFISTVE